jgi:bla regulator protein BlaR1
VESFLCFAASNAVTATLLAVFVAIIARFCRKAAVRHALWLLVLLKLLAPPLLPLTLTWPHIESTETHAPVADPPLAEPAEPIVFPNEPQETVEMPATDSPTDSVGFVERAMPLVITVWFGGSFLWWTIALVRLRKFHRLLRQANPAAADVQAQAHRLAARMGLRRSPPVAFVSAPLSPLLWALGLSPRLLLPWTLWQRLDAEQRDTIVAHELAHLRRGDQWIRRLEFVVLGLYWWHPVVWWARRRLQEAEEECCDDLVVFALPESASAYASALIETVTFLSQARAAELVGASGAGQVPLLKRRLTMILTENRSHRPARAVFWLVLGLGAILLPLAPGARTEAPKEGEGKESPKQEARIEVGTKERAESAVQLGVRWLANKEQFCGSCHQVSSVNPHDLHQKPQDWQDAHGEAVRLMDQYTRLLRQSDLPKAAAESNRGEEMEKLQDEIDLLRLRIKLKETQLRNAKTVENLARKRIEDMERLNRTNPGTIPRDTIDEITVEAEKLAAEARVREIELQEARLHLKQAERRLARLQRPAGIEKNRAEQEKRLRELEQKVDGLLKELRNLRRDMQPDKPRPPAQGSAKPDEDRLWKEVGLRLLRVDGEIQSGGAVFHGGMIVKAVRGASPAQRAGLRVDDILVGLDKFEVLSRADVHYIFFNGKERNTSRPLKFYYLRGRELKNGKFEFDD